MTVILASFDAGSTIQTSDGSVLIDDFSSAHLVSRLGTRWRFVSDRVMGGVSAGEVSRQSVAGRMCLRLTGSVSLENNGGFIQAALDLAVSGETYDASRYEGIRLVARGNGERYGVHLRTPDNTRPWQSYRSQFTAAPDWQGVHLPFSGFQPHRVTVPLNTRRLVRIGLVAIGRAFAADLAVDELGFYP